MKTKSFETFTYDEVIEIMSNCLNHLDEQVDTDEVVQIGTYNLQMYYENKDAAAHEKEVYVSIADATFKLDDLYNEISSDFRDRLNDLAKYKTSLS